MKSLQQFISESAYDDEVQVASIRRDLTINYEQNVKAGTDSINISLTPNIKVVDMGSSNKNVRKSFGFDIYFDAQAKNEEDLGGYLITDYKLQVRYRDKKRTLDSLKELDDLIEEDTKDRVIYYIRERLTTLCTSNRFFINKKVRDTINKEFESIFK